MSVALPTRQAGLAARPRLGRPASADTELLVLKPLGGSEDEVTGLYLPLGGEQPKDAPLRATHGSRPWRLRHGAPAA